MHKQVDISHYYFKKYLHKKRWISIWHQLDEILALNPSSILEIGPGPGVLKALTAHFGIKTETVDLDPELKPDYVALTTNLPFKDKSYDCVCAFQILEHLPYEQSLKAFGEMVRVAKGHVIISLPDAKSLWSYSLYIPKLQQYKIIHIPRPRLRREVHQFQGEHYWEINKRGFPLQKIINDFSAKNANLIRTYRLDEWTYHRFFVFEKISPGQNHE